jgi:hypothetical protein
MALEAAVSPRNLNATLHYLKRGPEKPDFESQYTAQPVQKLFDQRGMARRIVCSAILFAWK